MSSEPGSAQRVIWLFLLLMGTACAISAGCGSSAGGVKIPGRILLSGTVATGMHAETQFRLIGNGTPLGESFDSIASRYRASDWSVHESADPAGNRLLLVTSASKEKCAMYTDFQAASPLSQFMLSMIERRYGTVDTASYNSVVLESSVCADS